MSRKTDILKKVGTKAKQIGKPKNQTRARVPQSTAFYKGRQVTTNSSQRRLQQKNNYRRKRLSEQKRADLFQQLRRVGVYALLIVAGFYILQSLQLRSFNFQGLELTEDSSEELTQISKEYVSGLQSLKPFFNESDFEKYLLDKISYAADVSVSTSVFSSTVTINVEPKQPVLVYESILPSAKNLAIAQDGSLITIVPEDASDISVALIDASGVAYEPGEQVLSKRQIIFIDQLAEQFELRDSKVSTFQITDQPKEISVRIEGTTYDVLVNQDRSATSIASDYEELILSLPGQGSEVSSYIDLRVIDKAFYK